MIEHTTPILAKAVSSSGGSAEPREKGYNAITTAALQEASDIMSGKKKVKWSRFQLEATKEEAKEVLENILGS